MKIAHTADWHLCANLLYGRQDLTISPGMARLQELKSQAIKIINHAVSQGCELLVVCGDVFNYYNPDNPSQHVLAEIIQKSVNKNLPIRIISGDHDFNGKVCALDSMQTLLHAIPHPALRIITPKTNFESELLDENTIAYYLPWQKDFKQALALIKTDMKQYKALTKILFTHIDVAGVHMSNKHKLPDAAVQVQDFNGFDIVLLGNFHNNQIFGAKRQIAYAGSISRLNFGEANNKTAYNVVDTKTKSIRPIRMPDIQYQEIILTDSDFDDTKSWKSKIPENINQNTIIKLRVESTQTLPIGLVEFQQQLQKLKPRQVLTQVHKQSAVNKNLKIHDDIIASPLVIWKQYLISKKLEPFETYFAFGKSALEN